MGFEPEPPTAIMPEWEILMGNFIFSMLPMFTVGKIDHKVKGQKFSKMKRETIRHKSSS